MTRIHNRKDNYLVKNQKLHDWAVISYTVILFFVWYVVFIKNFHFLLSWVGIIVLIISFGPTAIFTWNELKKHDRKAGNFYRGRSGEDLILNELAKLPDNYVCFSDIKIPGAHGNIDLVLLGPTGVFAIEVKSSRGLIRYNHKNHQLMRNGFIFNKDPLKQSMAESLELHNFFLRESNWDIFVEPILIFSSHFSSMRFGLNAVRNVYVVKKGLLKELILSNNNKLSDENISKIEAVLDKIQDKTSYHIGFK